MYFFRHVSTYDSCGTPCITSNEGSEETESSHTCSSSLRSSTEYGHRVARSRRIFIRAPCNRLAYQPTDNTRAK